MKQAIIYTFLPASFTKSLPKLIETVWGKDNRILIHSIDQAQLQELDNLLWSYEQLSFLPHVIDGDSLTAETPIVLTTGEINLNNSNILLCLENKLPQFATTFDKVLFINKNEPGRHQDDLMGFIDSLKSGGFEVTQHIQGNNGTWQKIN